MINSYIKPYKIFRDLRKNLSLSTRELRVIQERKLRTLLNHAYENVPFYRRLFDSVGVKPKDITKSEDLYKIPTITKSQINNDKKDMLARNIGLSSCVEFKTSGSTGINLTVLFTRNDVVYNRGSYERVRNENGLRMFRDTLLIFGSPHTIPDKRRWYQCLGIRRMEGLDDLAPLDVQIRVLQKTKPDGVWGFPSAIKLLAKRIQTENIKGIFPRLIFTQGEVLDPETRSIINSVFKVKLFDVYGAYETGCMAWECDRHSGYHVNMDTVLIEFLDEKGTGVNSGERGRVVVTNLHSFAMPIIRYEMGDFAVPTHEECPCGRGGYLIKEIEGRYDDFIKIGGSKLISPRIPNQIIDSIRGVLEFRVIQEKEDELVIYVVKMDECKDILIAEEIDREFKKALGDDIFVNIKFVESIPREKSGKLRSVVSRC
jgi:phenylacetate-CoA ligase